MDLSDASLYTNRELSLLEFNRRVLAQARDPRNPLLERLRFLTICSSNLDEFFEIRAAGVKAQVQQRVEGIGSDGSTPRDTMRRISEVAHELVAQQYEVLTGEMFPALEEQGIHVLYRARWSERVHAWAADYFAREVQPVLTPVGLDLAHPFPMVLNKSLNFIVSVEGDDAFGRSSGLAVVQAPRVLPRLIALPEDIAGAKHHFLSLSGILHENVGRLFPGMKVIGCHPFRVTRNSDLWVDEEEVDDLLRALKGELRRRHYADAVRLEVRDSCPEHISQFLLEHFDLSAQDLYQVRGPVNVYRLAALYDLVDRPDLKYPPLRQTVAAGLDGDHSFFERVRQGDVLLHHPFESFGPALGLLREAAEDPDVLAIKATLYRTGAGSPITDALLDAARNGKEVTAVVEVRARFDEEANIQTATRLQQVGAKVAYGVVGYKAHAKMILIVRREGGVIRRYVHLGTGNYHVGNTRAYTDWGLLSCNAALAEDVHDVFNEMTGLGQVGPLRKLVQSPFSFFDWLLGRIEQEIEAARRGDPAWIKIKVNSLSERQIIEALYRASMAGVDVELWVRGICCLRPGVPGISDRIRVYSLIGRHLEHHRVYCFCNGGDEVVFCGSADLMPRNLFYRVEVAFPVETPALKARVRDESFDPEVREHHCVWSLGPDGVYVVEE